MQKSAKTIKPTVVHAVDNDDDFDIPEFDFSRAVPNRFAERCKEGMTRTITDTTGKKTFYVSLDADVAVNFTSPKAVNDVLRLAMKKQAKNEIKKGQKVAKK